MNNETFELFEFADGIRWAWLTWAFDGERRCIAVRDTGWKPLDGVPLPVDEPTDEEMQQWHEAREWMTGRILEALRGPQHSTIDSELETQ